MGIGAKPNIKKKKKPLARKRNNFLFLLCYFFSSLLDFDLAGYKHTPNAII